MWLPGPGARENGNYCLMSIVSISGDDGDDD